MPTPRNAESRIPRFSTQRSDKRKLYAKASAYQLAALLSEIQFFCKISPSFDQRELTRERPSHSSLPSSCVAATNGAGLSHGTSPKGKKNEFPEISFYSSRRRLRYIFSSAQVQLQGLAQI